VCFGIVLAFYVPTIIIVVTYFKLFRFTRKRLRSRIQRQEKHLSGLLQPRGENMEHQSLENNRKQNSNCCPSCRSVVDHEEVGKFTTKLLFKLSVKINITMQQAILSCANPAARTTSPGPRTCRRRPTAV
jgi:hypothetical protein